MQTAAKSLTAESSWEESVSAWMDGEGSEDFFPEMSHPHGRQTWDTYHLIGDALRNADLAVSPSAQFQARLARALEAELPIVAGAGGRSHSFPGLSGLALAPSPSPPSPLCGPRSPPRPPPPPPLALAPGPVRAGRGSRRGHRGLGGAPLSHGRADG